MQQLEPRVHHAEPFVVAGKILAFLADDFSYPLFDFGVVYVVIVDPVFVAGVVGRVDVDELYPAFVLREQGLKGEEVVAVDYKISFGNPVAVRDGVFRVGVFGLEGMVGYVQVVVEDFFFAVPG